MERKHLILQCVYSDLLAFAFGIGVINTLFFGTCTVIAIPRRDYDWLENDMSVE